MARTVARASSQYLRSTTGAGVSGFPCTLHCLYKPIGLPISNLEEHTLLCAAKSSALDDIFIELYKHSDASQMVRAVSYSNGAAQARARYRTQTLGTGVWYAITGVFTNSTTFEVYVDAVAGSAYMGSGNPSPSGLTDLIVGSIVYNTSNVENYANGDIAEVAAWSAALTSEEVSALSARVSPQQVRPGSLVSYAPMHGRGGASGNEEEWVGGLTLTQTNSPALADHPRIIYPRRRTSIWVPQPAASAPTITALSAISITATSAQPRISYS